MFTHLSTLGAKLLDAVEALRKRIAYRQGTPPRGRVNRNCWRYRIDQHSHPRKVVRWLSVGGGVPTLGDHYDTPERPHIHPRYLRA